MRSSKQNVLSVVWFLLETESKIIIKIITKKGNTIVDEIGKHLGHILRVNICNIVIYKDLNTVKLH